MSDSEELLWQALRRKAIGFGVRRQHPIGDYVLDFYVSEAKLCIEVDGFHHELRPQADAARDSFLGALGIATIRFPAEGLSTALPYVIDRIYRECAIRTGRNPLG